ncbi:MAG: FAD:protein FMN transferase [Thiobacillus sp.]|nr:FAD:protein FMN transferase [Thiobacillus sp.]
MNSGAARVPAAADYAMKRARPLLGTLVEIGAQGGSEADVNRAISRAFAAVETIHRLMSFHDPASDVSRLNRTGMGCICVDPHTWHVLDVARSLSDATDGVFDVSVAPALVRYGYLPNHADFPQPDPDAHWRHIELLPDCRVRLTRPVQIDLGGIAKGYAVDCAIHALEDAGMTAGRVNAGGDLRLFGTGTETIHVRHPRNATRLMPLCQMSEGAIATSALYFSERRLEGRPVSPLIDARTRGACTDSSSVSVLADDCIVADALTKVVFARPEAAWAALNQFGAHAVVLEAEPELSETASLMRARVRRPGPAGWHVVTTSEPPAAAA